MAAGYLLTQDLHEPQNWDPLKSIDIHDIGQDKSRPSSRLQHYDPERPHHMIRVGTGAHLGSWSFGGPGYRTLDGALTGQAATGSSIADGQVGGAAVLVVLAAGCGGQRAAGPGEAEAKEVPHAAARAPCPACY